MDILFKIQNRESIDAILNSVEDYNDKSEIWVNNNKIIIHETIIESKYILNESIKNI